MALFSSKLLITSDNDLKYYLKKHKKTYRLIQNGDLILSLDQLSSVSKPKGKTGVIINTLHGNNTGHWVLLAIDQRKRCLFVDSLASTFHTNKDLQNEVISFCDKHNLNLIVWNVQSQSEESQSCGFQIMFFLHFFSKYGLAKLLNLRKLLKHFSVKQAEQYILQRAYILCTWNFCT